MTRFIPVMRQRTLKNGYMRFVPHVLTVLRMLAAAALCFVAPFSAAFTGVYLLAGVSDVFDGFLARRFHVESALGAKLDSIADLMFTAAALYRVVPAVPWKGWMLLWAAGIALLRLMTLCIGWRKYRALPLMHTLMNKATGVLLFLFPFLYGLIGLVTAAWIPGIIASAASLEELILTLSRGELDRDVRGLLFPSER